MNVESGRRLANERSLDCIANARGDERCRYRTGKRDVNVGGKRAGRQPDQNRDRRRVAVAVGERDRTATGRAPGHEQAARDRIVGCIDPVKRRSNGERTSGARHVDRQVRANRNAGARTIDANRRRLRSRDAGACYEGKNEGDDDAGRLPHRTFILGSRRSRLHAEDE